MPNETLNGIVLRTTDYRESDRILNVFTREKGLVAVTSRGCRKQSSKLAAFSNQFCYGEMEVYERAGKLYLSNATIEQSFYSIRESYEQLLSATQIIKISERVLSREIANIEMFPLLFTCLSLIAYGDNDPRDIELCYLVKMLKFSGYGPVLTRCVVCGRDVSHCRTVRFSAKLGGSVCESCGGSYPNANAITLEALRRMANLDIADVRKVKLPDAVRNELYPMLYDYAEYNYELALRI